MTERISRRTFLIAAGAGAVAIAGAAALISSRGDTSAGPSTSAPDAEGVPPGTYERLSAFLTDHDGAHAIGLIRRQDQKASPAELAVALAPGGDPSWWAEVDADGFARHVREASRADFGRGDLAAVNGWRLATTEADLCALWTYR